MQWTQTDQLADSGISTHLIEDILRNSIFFCTMGNQRGHGLVRVLKISLKVRDGVTAFPVR